MGGCVGVQHLLVPNHVPVLSSEHTMNPEDLIGKRVHMIKVGDKWRLARVEDEPHKEHTEPIEGEVLAAEDAAWERGLTRAKAWWREVLE